MSTIFITGGHSGLGLECSRKLASTYQVDLVLAGRNRAAMEPVAQELRSTYGINVRTIEMDTSSLASVRAGVACLHELLDDKLVGPLQAVICNAGVRMNGPVSYSPDQYETTIATNLLGHALLVQLLLDKLSNDGRVILTTSGTHDPDTPDGKMMGIAANYDAIGLANTGKDGNKPVDNGKLYSTSKLFMIQFTYELDRRLRAAGGGITTIAYDPGATQGTGFLRSMPKIVQWLAGTGFMKWVMKRSGITIGTVEFSGECLALLAADNAYKNISGKYFQSNDGKLIERPSSKLSYDETRALKLWIDIKELIDLKPIEEPKRLAKNDQS